MLQLGWQVATVSSRKYEQPFNCLVLRQYPDGRTVTLLISDNNQYLYFPIFSSLSSVPFASCCHVLYFSFLKNHNI